jgi:hypothetical protein
MMRHAIRFLAITGLLAVCDCADAAITLVAHKIAKEITGAEMTALAAPGYESKAGNTIVIWAVSFSGAQPVGLVTDSAGDTFVPLTLQRGTWYGQFFYAKNVKGDSFNVVTVHPAITGRATFIYTGINVLEYSGVDKNAPIGVDIAGPQGALNGTWTSTAFDAKAGEVVLLGIVTGNGGAFTAGAGFKIEDQYLTPNASKFSFALMDQTMASAQTGAAAAVTWTGTLQATGAVVSLKPAP